LADEFGSLEALENADLKTIASIHGIGTIIANEINDFFNNQYNKSILKELKLLGVNPIQNNNKTDELKGLTFVLTGTLETLTRDEASEIIKKMGGKTSSSVSKNTSYVLAGANAGSKLDKAQKLNIPILTEQDFLSMIEK